MNKVRGGRILGDGMLTHGKTPLPQMKNRYEFTDQTFFYCWDFFSCWVMTKQFQMVPISWEGPNSMGLAIAKGPISWYVYKYIYI